MPFGVKPDAIGNQIDFDGVYREFIQAAMGSLELDFVRCDEIEEAGSIHRDMFEHLVNDDVAIVDITTLNPNVFYELGIRHACNSSVTVLILKRGSPVPFNIQGLRVLEYPDPSGSYGGTIQSLQNFVLNGLESGRVDSPVRELIESLEARTAPDESSQRIVKLQSMPYLFSDNPSKRITIITGDIQDRRNIDIWVNSENTNMQMARLYERGMSALIRYLGAKKDLVGEILEDTVAIELAGVMAGRESVNPSTVIPTNSGSLLESHGVKKIFHAAAVMGTSPGDGYRSIPAIDQCITRSLGLADHPSLKEDELRTIAFPLMGTGTGGGDVFTIAPKLIQAAVSYLVATPQSTIENVFFLAWNLRDVEACTSALGKINELKLVAE